MDWRKLLKGLRKISAKHEGAPLARETAAALRAGGLRAWLILAEGDATGIAAARELEASAFKGLIEGREIIESDSHTFAREGDEAALLAAVERALRRSAPIPQPPRERLRLRPRPSPGALGG